MELKIKKSTIAILLIALGVIPLNAQLVIVNDTTFKTAEQMLLANELFESGEPFAEALGYNLDLLDPTVPDSPDTLAYTFGIENYEYSRYLLSTVAGRSGIGLHIMWSPVITSKAAMMPANFDGMFTGGTPNGYKEDDVLMMMIQDFSKNAGHPAPMNAFPQFADFIEGNTMLPQTVAANYLMDFGSTRWNRNKMDKVLNPAAMGQTALKQYYWAQDMLGAFHDSLDNEIVADGTNSPDSANSPNFDPNNNIYYGGNGLDGYIGQVLTAEAINKTQLLINSLAYDGTSLGAVDPATYDPANGIKYFPTKIAVTETNVGTGLPPKASSFSVIDANSLLFDQLSYLLATLNFKNMMDPTITDAKHYAYREVFDGYPFPSAMGYNGATQPGPFDLMKGTSKVIFLNLMAMHYNPTEGTFVDSSSLNSSGQAVMGNTITAENAGYILVALAKFKEEFAGTPLETMATNALNSQVSFIETKLKDPNGGYYNSYTIGSGADNSPKTLAANSAIIVGLYAAYNATNNASYLTSANNAYNFLINNFYNANEKVFKTEIGNNIATYTPWNLALLSGAMREAKLTGNQNNADVIYARVFKNVYNKMILAEGDNTGETGNDSDGDGIPYLVGGNKPFVFAAEATYSITTGIKNLSYNSLNISVYPNPAAEFVNVEIPEEIQGDVSVNIYTLVGKKVVEANNLKANNTVRLSVKNLAPGVYFLRVSSNNEPLYIEKLIVN